MRNLVISSLSSNKLPIENINLCCIVNEHVYYLSENLLLYDESDIVYSLSDTLQAESRTISVPVNCEFCNFTENVVVALSGGDLLEYNTQEKVCKYTGCIEPGIAAAAWSPGEDLYAVVSTASNLLIFNSDINEPLVETDLTGEGVEKIVAVGWGKKETQFRGKEGKFGSAKTINEAPTLVRDDGKVRISWRGDGEYLAVSMLIDELRYITVLNKEGILLHRSETTPGLESALCWRPSGNLIASSERLPNKHNISFFEKNTLPHGSFVLSGDYSVRELLWSSDSHILAAVLEGGGVVIKLFTCNNYHWYHKLSIPVADNFKLVWVGWDKLEVAFLHVVLADETSTYHFRYTLRFAVNGSVSRTEPDEAFVGVIDGSQLLVTGFRSAIVPPPMSSYSIDCSIPINAVSFLQDTNDFTVQLMDQTILFYKYDKDTRKHVRSGQRTFPKVFQHFWVSPDLVLGLNVGGQAMSAIKLSDESFSQTVDLPCVCGGITNLSGNNSVLVWSNSELVELNLNSLELSPSSFSPPSKGKLVCVEVYSNPVTQERMIFALDSSHRLYMNSKELYNNITSMRLDDDVLLMTTLQHKLLCWTVGGEENRSSVPERAIERGARIITTVTGTGKVVLQLPRGNLEVVKPRLLSMKIINTYLKKVCYAEAYAIMRTERINLNLLHDHDPSTFVNNADVFIHSIKDQNYLCNFIAELSEENVTKTTYKQFCDETPDVHGKVSHVCSTILDAISKTQDPRSFYLLQLFCLVKKGDIEGALKTFKADNSNYSKKLEGLTHLLYLVDIDRLFKEALGTYDFELVLFIAENSHKDPKEYLPFIELLKSMDENYRKFSIDKFLKRHEKALEHLSRCPEKDREILEFVVTHSLYDLALRIFPVTSPIFKQVCIKYGEELTRQKQHTEAGNIYLSAGQHDLALFSFTRSGEWRRVMACADSLKFSNEKMSALIASLVDSLKTDKRFEDAGRLLIEFGGDVAGGVAAFCSAQLFKEACSISRNGNHHLIDSVIKPAALSAHVSHIEYILRTLETVKRQTEQLERVRERRRLQEDNGEVDWDDSASDSSYGSSRGSSRGSRASTVSRSAKNARKLERKLLSLKEGGPFEDVALVASLYDTISELVTFKDTVHCLNEVLIELDETSKASELQTVLKGSLHVISEVRAKVWPSEGDESNTNSIEIAFAERADNLPAVVLAVRPKIISPPDMRDDVDWEFSCLEETPSS